MGKQIIKIAILSESQFSEIEDEWSSLRALCKADPLFMSWRWQFTWWHHFAKRNDLRLYIMTANTGAGKLVGIAPFVIRIFRLRGIRTRRLEPIGGLWQGQATARAEYLEPLVIPKWRDAACDAFAHYLTTKTDVDEIAMPDCLKSSKSANSLFATLSDNWYVREIFKPNEFETSHITLPEVFTVYTSGLGQSTRRSLYTKRRFLESLGEVAYERAGESDIVEFLAQLNEFHSGRWGRPAFEGPQLNFHQDICRQYQRSGNLNLTRLSLSGMPRSVSYNIRTENRVYNLQLGFDESFHRSKLSLGLLHLGYDIENAIQAGIAEFDLLAGFGKKTDYKKKMARESKRLICLHAVRVGWRSRIYRVFSRSSPERLIRQIGR